MRKNKNRLFLSLLLVFGVLVLSGVVTSPKIRASVSSVKRVARNIRSSGKNKKVVEEPGELDGDPNTCLDTICQNTPFMNDIRGTINSVQKVYKLIVND